MAVDKVYTLTMGNKTWAVDCPRVTHSGDAEILSNVYNMFGVVDNTLNITKGNEKPNVVNTYIIRFTAGTNCFVNFFGWELSWVNGESPAEYESGKIYEITIIDNFAAFIKS